MIDWFQAIILAILQGITEFLPVSSSAHLILLPKLLNWEDQGLAFDVVVHLGTLFAVLVYFKHDLKNIVKDFFLFIKTKNITENGFLGISVLVGTLPVAIFGFLSKDFIETYLRAPSVIALTTIIFGVALWYAVNKNKKMPSKNLSWRSVITIGFMQALALIPGTSRSGITITAGLLSGLNPVVAARYSFLLSVPVIVLASISTSISISKSPLTFNFSYLFLGFIFSAVSGFFCIKIFIKLLEKVGVMPFVIYRMLLGIFLIKYFVL